MSELDEAWALALAEAEAHARAAGRSDVADYLALRTSNDLLRTTGSRWLMAMFEKAAGEANRAGGGIQISRQDGHRFKVGAASMVGSHLTLARGVRMLSVEAGWPRAPRDGFIRDGGLACAHIKHRGIRSVSEDLRLVLDASGTPRWIVHRGRRETTPEVHEADIRNHIKILLDDSRIHSQHF